MILWTVPSESGRLEDISLIQICWSAFTIFVTAYMFSSFEAAFGRSGRMAIFVVVVVFLPLSPQRNKPCHLLMVACEEALDPTGFHQIFVNSQCAVFEFSQGEL